MALPDVCVVGAGPAGLAVAIGAARRGMRVRVMDAARAGPVDKACGEGLLPDALASLDGLGVSLPVGHALAGIRFHGGGRSAEALFRGRPGRGIRRTELHEALLVRAEALGVRVEWGRPLRSLDEAGGGFVVGADGMQSRVRGLAGMEGRVTTRRVGLRQHFAVRPWSGCVEVFWGDGAQAYVTPVGPGQVGVAFLSRRRFSSVAEALEGFPELRDRLRGAVQMSAPRGALTVTRRLRRVTRGGRIALLGDASGSVDAITGEGINLCLRQADGLVEALVTGDLRGYERAHRATMRGPRGMSAALLLMGGSRVSRGAGMALLGGAPGLFEALLHLHAGAGGGRPAGCETMAREQRG